MRFHRDTFRSADIGTSPQAVALDDDPGSHDAFVRVGAVYLQDGFDRRLREALGEPVVRCPDCWKGKPTPCAVGCRDTNACCDKSLVAPCERCGGTGTL